MIATFDDRVSSRARTLAGDSFSLLNPARTIEDNLLINVDGSFGIGLRCEFPNGFTIGGARRMELFSRLRAALNVLPEDYDVQFVFDDHTCTEDLFPRLAPKLSTTNTVREQTEQLLREYADEQMKQLYAGFETGFMRFTVGHVCIVRKNPFSPAHFRNRAAKQNKDQPFWKRALSSIAQQFGAGELSIQYSEEEWDRIKDEFCAIADTWYTELATVGFKPVVLDADGALELLYQYYHPASFGRGGRARKYNPSEDLPISDYFLKTGPKWNRLSGIFEQDGEHMMVATLESPPEKLNFSQFEQLLLPSGQRGIRLTITLRHADLEKRKLTVQNRLPELETLSKRNPLYEAQFLDADRELRELGKGDEKAWFAQVVFLLRAPSPEALRRKMTELAKFGERNIGLKVVPETHAVIDYYIAAQPFWTRDTDLHRLLPFNTSQATALLPVFGQPGLFDDALGKPGRIGAVHETTTGSLVNLFLHDDTRFSNFNTFVIGGSGKGKGVILNDLIAQYKLRQSCRFVVIDADLRSKGGGSYRRTAMCLDGDYQDFDLTKRNMVVNPFYTESNHYPDQEELDGMVTAVERFLVTDATRRLEPEESGAVEATIKQCFRKFEGKQEVTLTDFKQLLAENDRAKHLAPRLARWTGDGAYANLFDGKNQLTTSKWLTVFNLTKVKDNKAVCPIVFANIFATVAQLASRYPNDYKAVIFDECADFLKDPIVAAYIEKCYRQMRKAGVAVIGASQSLEEYLSTDSKTGFINNTDHLILLQQGSTEVADMIREQFRFSEAEYATLVNLKSDPGNFSQVMLRHKIGDGSFVSDVIIKRPTPLGYAMATTNPRDHEAFEKLREQGLDFSSAVRRFATQFPNGVSRAA